MSDLLIYWPVFPPVNVSSLCPSPPCLFFFSSPSRYQIRQMLGAGSYAKVHLGVHKTTGQQVAVKIIDKKKMVGGSSRADAVHDEVSTLQRVSHPNIIQIYNHFEDETNVYLVLELVVGGELFDFVVK